MELVVAIKLVTSSAYGNTRIVALVTTHKIKHLLMLGCVTHVIYRNTKLDLPGIKKAAKRVLVP